MKWFASSVFWKASIVCSPSFCMERACGSVGFATAGQGSGFRSRHDHRAEARAQGSGLDVARAWHPACASSCRVHGMVAEGPGRGPQRRCAPDALERKYPRAGHSWPWFWVFAQHTHSTDPRSGVVRRHHMYDQTFQRAFKRAVEQAGITKPTAHPPPLVRDGLAPQRLRHSNRAGSARPFRRLYDDDLPHVLKVGGAASERPVAESPPASADGRQQPVVA